MSDIKMKMILRYWLLLKLGSKVEKFENNIYSVQLNSLLQLLPSRDSANHN